jgi:hypothetical protein
MNEMITKMKKKKGSSASDESEEDNSGALNSNQFSLREMDDDFAINVFKIQTCSKVKAHDWTVCPYAHPQEKAKRRCLQRFQYCAIPCAEYQKCAESKTNEFQCPRGDACHYAHGVFESWLHSSRYRTQLCKDGMKCTRKACFFAHKMSELRSLPVNNNKDICIERPNSNASSKSFIASLPEELLLHYQNVVPASTAAAINNNNNNNRYVRRYSHGDDNSWENAASLVAVNGNNNQRQPSRRLSIDSVNLESYNNNRNQQQQQHFQNQGLLTSEDLTAHHLFLQQKQLQLQQLQLVQQIQYQQQLEQVNRNLQIAQQQRLLLQQQQHQQDLFMSNRLQSSHHQHHQQHHEEEVHHHKNSYDNLGLIEGSVSDLQRLS